MSMIPEMPKHPFIITNHARERFVERFTDESYLHLRRCKDARQGCDRCVSLLFKLKREVDAKRRYLDTMICDKLHEAKETRIHHNNSEFMACMYDKYGYEQFHFLISGDILFVVVDAVNGKCVVTCMDARTSSVVGDFVRRPKYKKAAPELCV